MLGWELRELRELRLRALRDDRLTIIAENAVLVTNPCVKNRVIFNRGQYGIDLVNPPIRDMTQ